MDSRKVKITLLITFFGQCIIAKITYTFVKLTFPSNVTGPSWLDSWLDVM